jgi:hypothetical protein
MTTYNVFVVIRGCRTSMPFCESANLLFVCDGHRPDKNFGADHFYLYRCGYCKLIRFIFVISFRVYKFIYSIVNVFKNVARKYTSLE